MRCIVRALEDAGEATARPCLEYRSEKNFSPKKVQKSLRKKKRANEKGTRESIMHYASFCTLFALIMHNDA